MRSGCGAAFGPGRPARRGRRASAGPDATGPAGHESRQVVGVGAGPGVGAGGALVGVVAAVVGVGGAAGLGSGAPVDGGVGSGGTVVVSLEGAGGTVAPGGGGVGAVVALGLRVVLASTVVTRPEPGTPAVAVSADTTAGAADALGVVAVLGVVETGPCPVVDVVFAVVTTVTAVALRVEVAWCGPLDPERSTPTAATMPNTTHATAMLANICSSVLRLAR